MSKNEKSFEISREEQEHADDGSAAPVPGDHPDDEDEEPDFQWNATVLVNLATLIFVYLASIWNYATPSSAIAYIAARFPDETGDAAWIASSVTIVLTVLQCILGDLSDLLGRRQFLLAGCVVGTVGITIGSRATSLKMVIGGQVLNAVGTSCGWLCVPLLQEMVPKIHRPTVTAVSVFFISLTGMIAPISEGAFILRGYGGTLDGWRIGLYIGTGLYALSFILTLIFYHPKQRDTLKGLTVRQKLLKIDWIGIFLLAGSLTTFLVGISFGDNPYPWKSGQVLGTLLTGAVGILAFCLWEWKGTREGIVPHALFKHRNFPLALLIRWAVGAAIFGAQAWGPVITNAVITKNGLLVAVWQLPLTVAVILGGFASGWAIGRWKECKPMAILALLFEIAGGGLTGLISPHMNFAVYCFSIGFIGFATGMENVALNTIASICTPNEMIATAVMLVNAMNTFGGAIALTIFSAIYKSRAISEIPAQITKEVLAAGFPAASLPQLFEAISTQNVTLIQHVPGATPLVLQAVDEGTKQGYANASHYVFYTVVGFGVLALIPSLWLTSTKSQLTNEVTGAAQTRQQWKQTHKSHFPADLSILEAGNKPARKEVI